MNEGMPSLLPDEMVLPHSRRRRRRGKDGFWRRRTRRLRHWIKEHKALSVIIGVILLLLLILLLWLLWLWLHIKNVPRFDIDLADPPPHAGTNILMVGLDCDETAAEGTFRNCTREGDIDLNDLDMSHPTGVRSDVIMVVHITEDGQNAQVVSIPRDSYVPVEGYGQTKINAAFSYGGPTLLTDTVQKLTGLPIDHVAVVDFDGFRGVTEAIGGVMVYVPEEVVDTRTGQVAWPQGWQKVEGEMALNYVRTRYGLPRGDFDRVQRHQNMIRAIMHRTHEMSVLANPLAVSKLVGEVAGNLAVDSEFSTGEMIDLAIQALQWNMTDVSYATVPLSGTGTAMIDGASVVTLDREFTKELFDAIANDQFAEFIAENQIETLPGERGVK